MCLYLETLKKDRNSKVELNVHQKSKLDVFVFFNRNVNGAVVQSTVLILINGGSLDLLNGPDERFSFISIFTCGDQC